MPSGAKKRKAAKKKKENNSSLSHGDDDVRRHDDQESVATETMDIKVEDISDNKDGKIEINEPNGKSCNGGSSESSCHDNSDDESRVLKNGPAVSSNAPFVDSLSETLDKDIHSSVKDEFDMSFTIDKSVPSSYVTDYVLKENGAKLVEDKVDNSAAAPEMKVDVQSVKNTAVLDATEHLLPEKNNNSTLLPNGVEQINDSGVTEPLLKPSLQPVEQKTSWKGCCGLFEVLMGSGR